MAAAIETLTISEEIITPGTVAAGTPLYAVYTPVLFAEIYPHPANVGDPKLSYAGNVTPVLTFPFTLRGDLAHRGIGYDLRQILVTMADVTDKLIVRKYTR